MIQKADFLQDIDVMIEKILTGYIKAQSFTYSGKEKEAEEYLMEHFAKIPYFKEHPEYYGTYDIEDDAFNRAVSYGMLKGIGNDTIVFVHHNDIVEVEDFKLLKPYAFSPKELEVELLKIKDSLPEDARKDLESKEFLFGRGTADMKGGGSIQLALLEKYSEIKDFKGNVIVIAVPDEENLSAGMRAAVSLLAELKDKYNLEYKMMINSEPHQRIKEDVGVFSEGSVGKIMPFVYVRGYLAHVGKVFEGLNPLNVMSEIVRKTEINMAFSDIVGSEMAPPPTWLYLKDNKKQYDVSMPISISGCFSILTLNRAPDSIMTMVESICKESFATVIEETKRNYKKFAEVKGLSQKDLPWKESVTSFAELHKEARKNYGEKFDTEYEKKLVEISENLKSGKNNIIECNFELVEFVYEYIDDMSPRVVFGLIPPYYPNVANIYFEGKAPNVDTISEELNKFTNERFGQCYDKEDFYTGICDLSYSSIPESKKTLASLEEFMPLFGKFYSMPVADIQKISMPCINIGPWGKDFHKVTERVCKDDLYKRTPEIINKAISILLG